MQVIFRNTNSFFDKVKQIGYSPKMDAYEKRRLGIFNLINFFGVLTGIFIPFGAVLNNGYLPTIAWVVAFAPFLISSVVLISNYFHKYQFSMMWYFILYPFITSLVYVGGVDVGIELFFILYGVLSVFFLQKRSAILITIIFSAVCYLVTSTLVTDYKFVMKDINFPFYFFNHLLGLFFIFLGLFLIKKENNAYQNEMQSSNNELMQTNTELTESKILIAQKAATLEEQKQQLTELDALKNRLFSIISHDLKTPIYSLRNLFRNVEKYDIAGDEIKILVPDIINDLNFTTSLMENLLLWAKSQMQGNTIHPQLLDIADLVNEVKQLLRLQAESKHVYVNSKIDSCIYVFADKDMINLVLRNILSNAIKFTPNEGEIKVGASIKNEMVEMYVEDSGMGISEENLSKLFTNNYFTTNGTANESGTGLGLMLCKEFLQKNGGEIMVESTVGKGSRFSFTIPKA
jgi:two-component system, sensor histidine kinase and response regulator